MSAGLRGTTTAGDGRFTDKESIMMRNYKFPKEFSKSVDVSRVHLDRLERWIQERLQELLGHEDEVLNAYVRTLLEQKELDPKRMQVQLSGFLQDQAPTFMKELWKLLLSAQENDSGIPQRLLDEDAERVRREQEEAEKLIQLMRQKQEDDRRLGEEEEKKIREHDRERYHRQERRRSHFRDDRRRSISPYSGRGYSYRVRSRSPRRRRTRRNVESSYSPPRRRGERRSPTYDPY